MSILRTLVVAPFLVPALAGLGLAYLSQDEPSWHSAGGDDSELQEASYIARAKAAEDDGTSIFRAGCRAIDGDTLRCGRVRIRLLGIDAAELPGHCASYRRCAPGDPFAQRDALQRLVRGRLLITPVATDRFGRIVGQVATTSGIDLSCAMLAAGASYKPHWDNGYRIARTCPSRALSGSWRR